MSTATETCACGASITVDVRDGLTLGFRLGEWRKEHQHDDEVTRLRNWKAEALAVLAEWDGVYEALGGPATLGERKSAASFREVMRLREEAATGPSWNAVALRSALVAMTVERDDLRAAHERLDRDARAVAGRSLHYEARAEKAEAEVAALRERVADLEGQLAMRGTP